LCALSALVWSGLLGSLPGWLPSERYWAVALVLAIASTLAVDWYRDWAGKRELRELAEKVANEGPPPDDIADKPFCLNLRCDSNLSRLARKLADDASEQGRLTDAWIVHYQALEQISALQREGDARE
jgi:hypothetical protein